MEKYYIIRHNLAGVFFAQIESELPNGEMILKEAIRIHYWEGALDCIALATFGTSKPKNCRFSEKTRIRLLEKPIEIIECTPKAIECFSKVQSTKF